MVQWQKGFVNKLVQEKWKKLEIQVACVFSSQVDHPEKLRTIHDNMNFLNFIMTTDMTERDNLSVAAG